MWIEPIVINWTERKHQLEFAANRTFESFFLPIESLTWGFQVCMKVELGLEEGSVYFVSCNFISWLDSTMVNFFFARLDLRWFELNIRYI
jgi:hypothetical protein